MKRHNRKMLALLTGVAAAGLALTACQGGADTPGSSVVASALGRVTFYQDAQPKELPFGDQAQFDALVETVTQAVEGVGETAPQWVSSVVTPEWIEEALESGEVVKITFQEAREFTIGSEHRSCDELLLIRQGDKVVFGRNGQYQSGPLVVSAQDMKDIFDQVQGMHAIS